MANEFIARKGLIVSGSTTVTGSLNVSSGITGSLLGTGSWAQNTVSASYAATASILLGSVISASYAQTASVGLVAKAVDIIEGSIGTNLTQYTGSFTGSLTGTLIGTASWASNAVTASYVSGAASTWDSISNKPDGILSSSTQINNLSGVSASFATTASFVTTASFAVSSSRTLTSSLALSVDYTNITNRPTLISASSQVSYTELSNVPTGIVSSSSQVSYTELSNVPSGILSSSTQINALSGISASFATTASAATSITFVPTTASFATSASQAQTASLALSVDYTNVTNKPTLVSASSQIDVRNTTGIATIATTGSNTFTGIQTISDTTNSTAFSNGALIVQGGVGITKDVYISGSVNIAGLLTAVSTSTQYVTSSQLVVADNKIIVNVNDTVRFGGLSVIDSGSSSPATASIYWDSLNHKFIYENLSGSGYNSAIFIAGPKNTSALGNETGLVAGRIPVATDDDHIDTNTVSSSMYIDFATRRTHIEAGLNVTGSITASVAFKGDGSQVTGVISSSFATTASFAQQAGAVDYSNVTNKPTLVSASSQVSYTGLSNIPSGIVSSSAQITPLLPAGTVSSSGQVSYTGLSNIPTGILSSSTQINALSGVSASYSATASVLLGSVTSASFATTAATASSFSGSLQVVGLAEFAEGLVVSGGLYVSASDTTAANKVLVLNTSTWQVFTTASVGTGGGGSGNGFPFSGSALITGSLLISGSGLALQVSGSGSVRDNFTVNGSTFFVDAGNNRVGVGTLTPNARLTVSGSTNITGSLDVTDAFTAQTKSFKILHQRLPGKSLIYGVLEGPEHAVYARGRLQNDTIIILPEEWEWLVDMDSVTVQLTPIGIHQKLYVSGIYGTRIVIANENVFSRDIDCYYTVMATRKDVQPLQTVE